MVHPAPDFAGRNVPAAGMGFKWGDDEKRVSPVLITVIARSASDEAIQFGACGHWIASLSFAMTATP
jgi:hypothetical protein